MSRSSTYFYHVKLSPFTTSVRRDERAILDPFRVIRYLQRVITFPISNCHTLHFIEIVRVTSEHTPCRMSFGYVVQAFTTSGCLNAFEEHDAGSMVDVYK